MDRFSKACLGLIVVLLAVIALRPFVVSQPVHAAPQYKYAVHSYDDFEIPINTPSTKLVVNEFNQPSNEGWELISVVPITLTIPNNHVYTAQLLFIYRK
jgi:hypothetical protein